MTGKSNIYHNQTKMLFFVIMTKSFTAIWQEPYVFFINFCLQLPLFTKHTYKGTYKHLHI